MNLNARVSSVLIGGALIAKDQSSTAKSKDIPSPLVVGRVKPEGFPRATRGDECLDETVGRPGFVPPGLHHDRYLKSDGGQPERIHGR